MTIDLVAQQAVAIGGLTQLETWLLTAMATIGAGILVFIRFVVIAFLERHMKAFEGACASMQAIPTAIAGLEHRLIQAVCERVEKGMAAIIQELKDQRLVEIRRHLSSRPPEPAPESSSGRRPSPAP